MEERLKKSVHLSLSRGNSYYTEFISMVKSVEREMELLRPQPQLRQA